MSIAESFKSQFVAGVARAMKKQKISQSELARRMRTSRAVVYRMLLPGDVSLTLATMAKAASVLGVRISVKLS